VLGALSGFGIGGAGSSRASRHLRARWHEARLRAGVSSSTIRGPGLPACACVARLEIRTALMPPLCIRIDGPTAS
jgi:hypothetical protein